MAFLRKKSFYNDVFSYYVLVKYGGFWARLRVQIKYIFRERRAECDVPKHVLQAIVDDMMPDIRAFFESDEGKREFEKWKTEKEKHKLSK